MWHAPYLPDLFSIDVRPDRDRVVLEPIGEVDLHTAGEVRDRIKQLLEDGWQHVVLDLRQVTFMDSTGVHLLLDCQRRLAEPHHSFAIVDGTPVVKQLLDLTGLSERFPRASGVETTAAFAG